MKLKIYPRRCKKLNFKSRAYDVIDLLEKLKKALARYKELV